MRLIDADALAARYMNAPPDYYHTTQIVGEITSAPTVKTQDWVSVKDRMPEKNGEYLISTNEGVTSACYERGRRASEWTDYFEGYIDFEPTHWMPLPTPTGGES